MSTLLEHLGRDSLPAEMVDDFIRWCVFQQARPALVLILDKASLTKHAARVENASSYGDLVTVADAARETAHEARQKTGPLGLSASEAAAFLTTRLAKAATEAEWDPEGVAFFCAQVCGWAGFAETGFTDASTKPRAEAAARKAQEEKLTALWQVYSDKTE